MIAKVVSPNAKQEDMQLARSLIRHELTDVSVTYRDPSEKPCVVLVEGQEGMKAAGLGTKLPVTGSVCWSDKYKTFVVQTKWMLGLLPDELRSVGKAIKACVKGKQRSSTLVLDPKTFMADIRKRDVGIDFETTGLTPANDGILSVGVGLKENGRYHGYWWPIWHKEWAATPGARRQRMRDLLRWWGSGGTRIVHHAKFECGWVDWLQKAYGIKSATDAASNTHDTMMEKWLLDENTPHNLDWLSVQELGYKPYWLRLGPKDQFSDESLTLLGRYNALDAVAGIELHHRYWPRMTERQKILCKETLVPVSLVLARMEQRGMHVSIPKLKSAIKVTQKRANEIKGTLDEEWGVLNFNSVPQMTKLLFEQLGMPVLKTTPKGNPKMDADILEQLAKRDPNVALLSEYKKCLAKISNVLAKLLKLAESQDGVIHTNFNIGLTVTGRLSSSGPNLQNLERGGIEKTCFRSRFPGGWLLILDYKQHELRICAIESRDDNLSLVFIDGLDPHSETKANCRLPSRDIAKNVNFSFISGITPWGLEFEFGIPRDKGEIYKKRWFKRYPGVGEWHEAVISRLRSSGYVENLFGRRRHLPGILSKDRQTKNDARKQGLNYPIQGGGADLMYQAMNKVERALSPYNACLIGQVHDSAIIDCPAKEVKEVSAIVSACMKDFPFKVPLGVDVDVKKHL